MINYMHVMYRYEHTSIRSNRATTNCSSAFGATRAGTIWFCFPGEKRWSNWKQCNCFFRAVFEARNVINVGAITASDASQLWFVVGLRSVSSEECQLWANVVKNGGWNKEFSEIKNVLFFSRCSMRFAHAAPRGAAPPWTPAAICLFWLWKGPRSSWVTVHSVVVYNTTSRRQ